jgi:hypothetical protein
MSQKQNIVISTTSKPVKNTRKKDNIFFHKRQEHIISITFVNIYLAVIFLLIFSGEKIFRGVFTASSPALSPSNDVSSFVYLLSPCTTSMKY